VYQQPLFGAAPACLARSNDGTICSVVGLPLICRGYAEEKRRTRPAQASALRQNPPIYGLLSRLIAGKTPRPFPDNNTSKDGKVQSAMLVYVDETGDTGFKFADNSSRYFVIALVVFAGQEQADSTSQQIDALRHELRTPNIEFHFAKNKRSTRQAFLTRMRQAEFTAFALVVDKQKLSPANLPDRAAFYQAVCGVAFEKASYLFREADIYFDEGGGEKFQKSWIRTCAAKLTGVGRSGLGR